jgi:hypothetical protein
LTAFGIVAATLFLLSALLSLPGEMHSLVQAVAEALVVSIVVALAVEPRLLQHFGEELASQTFWTSFYSRAPEEYREAIRELAAATQFAVAINWKVTLDWGDDDQTVIRLHSEVTSYRENRSQKPFGYMPRSHIYESLLSPHKASIDELLVVCESATFYGHPIRDGFCRVTHDPDGRLVVRPAKESGPAYFTVPAGARYTALSKATTYVGDLGYAPLIITTPALSLTIELCGSALPDLWLSVLHPALGSFDTKISNSGAELAGKGPICIGEVGIVGQAILLYWARQQPRAIVSVGAARDPSEAEASAA